jgi:Flp pilus assembly pilin Flp
MRTMPTTVLADERGFAMTEWSILIGTVAFGAIVALISVGRRLDDVLATVLAQLSFGRTGR